MTRQRFSSVRLLGSPNSLNWRTHFFFAGIAILNLGLNDVDRLGGSFISWLPVGLIGLVVTVAAIEIGLRLLPKNLTGRTRGILVLAILLVAGILRGLAIFEAALLTGLVGPEEFWPRTLSAPVFVMISYFVSNAVFTSWLNYKQQQARLEAELFKLDTMRSSYEASLETVKAQQIGRVKSLLAPPMWELQKKFQAAGTEPNLQAALIELEAINNQVVRPLSRALYSERPEQVAREEVVASIESHKVEPRKLEFSKLQSPALYLLPLFVLGMNGRVLVDNFLDALQVTIISILIVALFYFIEINIFRERRLSLGRALLFSNLFGIVASLAAYVLTAGIGSVAPLYLLQLILGILVIKNLNLIFGVIQSDWVAQIKKLEEVMNFQGVVNSRLRQQIWLGQRALAMELHGSVQATLQALAIRLSKEEKLEPDQVSDVLETIQKSLSKIENLDYLAGRSIDELMKELVDLWEGTAAIRYELPSAVQEILQMDQALARCVYEVVREAVTNAVKHGSSTEMDISFSSDGETISLTVTNDGERPMGENQSLGSELFAQLCVENSLAEESGVTTFRAKLALSPKA